MKESVVLIVIFYSLFVKPIGAKNIVKLVSAAGTPYLLAFLFKDVLNIHLERAVN